MPVLANLDKMRRFARGVRSLGSGGLLRDTARYAVGAATVILGEVADATLSKTEGTLLDDIRYNLVQAVNTCFILQQDPDGKPWAERITRYHNYRDGNPILYNLYSSLTFTVRGSSVVIDSDKDYALYHQTGTRKMVARRWHPTVKAGKFADGLKLLAIRKIKGILGAG